jgi:hypothetical protein
VLMKPGWYRNNVGERVVQSMQKENGTQKGVQRERKAHERCGVKPLFYNVKFAEKEEATINEVRERDHIYVVLATYYPGERLFGTEIWIQHSFLSEV